MSARSLIKKTPPGKRTLADWDLLAKADPVVFVCTLQLHAKGKHVASIKLGDGWGGTTVGLSQMTTLGVEVVLDFTTDGEVETMIKRAIKNRMVVTMTVTPKKNKDKK